MEPRPAPTPSLLQHSPDCLIHFDREDWRRAAVAAIRAYGRQITRYPRAFAKSLALVDFLTRRTSGTGHRGR